MFRRGLFWFLGLIAGVSLTVCADGREPSDGSPRTVYFTVGDAQDLLEFAPLDSRESIATAFETLQEQWAVERIWWRGGQDEIWGEQFIIRAENRLFARIWDWWRDLQYREVGTNRIAVEEAHRRGMKISLTYGLFDNGSQPDAGYSGFPYAVEDKLRVKHPEWAPVNRWGTWRQGGPLEFAYPEAREAMASYLAKAVIDGGYDEISFLTYAENYSMRYEDEFGYNEPIVKEFQEKYGVDIRTEEFDHDVWRRMRGRYVTEFLRLLKQKLEPYGRRIVVAVHGKEYDRPVMWLVNGGVRTAGNFSWSIEEWLKGDVVDEICVYSPNDNPSVQHMLDLVKAANSPVRISAFRSRGELPGQTPRLMFLGREIESGYLAEAWVDYPDEQLLPEPSSSLTSDDVYARRRVLTLALKGKLTLSANDFQRALNDPDLYVRRTALRAITTHRAEGVAPAVQKCLADPENTVRCLAALALAELKVVDALPQILKMAADPKSGFQFQFRAMPEALKKFLVEPGLAATTRELLRQQLSEPHSHSREIALYAYTLIGAPGTAIIEEQLTRIVRSDESEYARELALINLRSSFGPTATVVATIRQVMQADPSHAVQARAAAEFATIHSRLAEENPQRNQGLEESIIFFRHYGDECRRQDVEWGWRLVGNAILGFGEAGSQALRDVMADPSDRQAADRAWKILHLKQGDQFFPVTIEEDAAAHQLHPTLRK